jgi:hypothetical protein
LKCGDRYACKTAVLKNQHLGNKEYISKEHKSRYASLQEILNLCDVVLENFVQEVSHEVRSFRGRLVFHPGAAERKKLVKGTVTPVQESV